MNPKNKLAEMPVRPLLYTMAVPLMLSLLIQSLYNIVDSIFVARLSETALTAASLVYAIQFLMIAIGVDANIDTSTHGNEASFEFIVDKNPDYIFAMDRDAAIGTDGAQMAQEILENELVKSTDAYKNGHVVYLAHPNVWYTAEGGIQALSEMLSDLENALL